MDAIEALENLELLGTNQWGLVTTFQARRNGISRLWMQRLSDRGVLQRLRHGVYALPTSRPSTLQDIQAAWLSITASTPQQAPEKDPTSAVVSGASAAAVYEIGDLIAPYIEISVPYARITKQSDLRLIHRELPADDTNDLDGLPVTTVERTIYDLSVAATDLDHLTTLAVDAARVPGVSIDKLAASLESRARKEGHPSGRAMLDEMLSAHGIDLESVGSGLNPYRQITQIITESLDPAIFESLRDSVSKTLIAQDQTSPLRVSKAWETILRERMPNLSAVTTDEANDHNHNDQNDQEEE